MDYDLSPKLVNTSKNIVSLYDGLYASRIIFGEWLWLMMSYLRFG